MGKRNAVANRRMVSVPEHDKLAGIGVGKRQFAQHLESMRGGFLRVGIDAMRDFQAINIGVVLQLPAEAVANRRGNVVMMEKIKNSMTSAAQSLSSRMRQRCWKRGNAQLAMR